MRGMIFSVLALTFLVSCDGTMHGVVRGTGEPVVFKYEQGLDSDIYTAVIGSETFKGRAVMVDANSTFGTIFGANGSNFFSGQSFTGRLKAVMHGSKGSTLRCLMQYADASGFTTSGGVGECKHSDGRTIDVVW